MSTTLAERLRLSLGARLAIAIGVVTLLALVLADLAVYASLRSYLYRQVDAQLESSHRPLESTIANAIPGIAASFGLPAPPSSNARTQSSAPLSDQVGPAPGALAPSSRSSSSVADEARAVGSASLLAQGGGVDFCNAGRVSAPGMFIELLGSNGTPVTIGGSAARCLAYAPGSSGSAPLLPAHPRGFVTTGSDPSEAVLYLSSAAATPGGPPFRVRIAQLQGGGELIVAISIGPLYSTLSKLLTVELLVTAMALLAAVLVGLWLIRVGLRPLRDVEATAAQIAAGDLSQRVANSSPRTEVGRLGIAFNVMLERISGAFGQLRASESRLRRFVGDASHELRTPIAAISAYAQLFRHGASADPADLDRVMSGIERESERMATLVEELLLLAKFDERPVLDPEPVELVGLAAEAVETARTVGPDWPLSFIADEPIEVVGDRGALRQAIDNLLANVRAHTPPGTAASLRVAREGDEVLLEVDDEGPGITAAQAEHVFERFFRADPSRSRETGGAGLGLAIVASIAHAHRGSVAAMARPGGGARFQLRLPAGNGSETTLD